MGAGQYCSQCGTALPFSAQFCPNCGRPAGATFAAFAPPSPPRRKRSRATWVIVVGLLLCVGLATLPKSGSSSGAATATHTPTRVTAAATALPPTAVALVPTATPEPPTAVAAVPPPEAPSEPTPTAVPVAFFAAPPTPEVVPPTVAPQVAPPPAPRPTPTSAPRTQAGLTGNDWMALSGPQKLVVAQGMLAKVPYCTESAAWAVGALDYIYATRDFRDQQVVEMLASTLAIDGCKVH